MYFYDTNLQAFLIEGVHQIPKGAIPVKDNEAELLIAGRAKGKEIILMNGTLTLTSPRPTSAHEWDGEKWTVNSEKLATLTTQRKAELINLLSAKTDQLKAEILAGYPQVEVESFYRQEQEANALKANAEANAPMLREIALSRGVPLAVLVEKVLEKAEQFALAIGAVLGSKQKFEDEIAKAETIEQLEAIQEEVEAWSI